jgi:hypothetical protein
MKKTGEEIEVEDYDWEVSIMSRITDYGFLFQTTFGTSKTNLINNIQLSQMNSSSVQKQLKAAGIDTNSKKYKAAM